jgi:membrane-bound lytic murein transglycosylase B
MRVTAVRRALVGATAMLCACALAAGPVLLTPARAASSAALSAQVQTLLGKVHHLQAKAKVAERRYSHAFASVADSVNSAISADQRSSAVAARAAAAQANLDAQIRGLYESGGRIAADAAVLTSGNINELYDRNVLVASAVSAQVASVQAAGADARLAAKAAASAERRAHLRIGTERTIAAAASTVETLLAKQSALLKKADRRLAAVRAAEAALAAETTTFSNITTTSIDGLHILPPSAEYLRLYKGAATTCPGLSWTVLAAIGQVESGHGRNDSTSSAGAEGPMQFEPATFAAYAVDGNHDGVKSIMDPADAIYTAAHYLCANGAGRGPGPLNNAIFHYNHAVWYVQMVLKLANMYATAYH